MQSIIVYKILHNYIYTIFIILSIIEHQLYTKLRILRILNYNQLQHQ